MQSQHNYTPMTAHDDYYHRAAERAEARTATEPLIASTLLSGFVPGRSAAEGVKHDSGKPEMALVPTEAIEEIAKAFTFGAKKYAANNWRKGFAWTRVASAMLRHTYAWLRGGKADPESGLSHLAHAGACLCFLLTFEVTKTGTDDRYVA